MPLIVDRFDDWAEYIPDVGDNRLEETPMSVEIRAMSTAEYKAVQRRWGPKLQGKQALGRAQRMVEKIIAERVRDVRHCIVVNHTTGDEVIPKTASDLLEHAPASLIDDIFAAIIDASHLSAGLRKNLQRQSDSSSRTIPPSPGTAENASGRVASKPANPAEKPFAGSETATEKATQALLGDSLPG